MNSVDNKAKILAERFAEFLLANEKSETDETKAILSTVLTKLDDLSNRIGKIENHLGNAQDTLLANNHSSHPSQQKFEIPEVFEVFLPGTKIKACTFEPNGKPCDNCAFCNTRGF